MEEVEVDPLLSLFPLRYRILRRIVLNPLKRPLQLTQQHEVLVPVQMESGGQRSFRVEEVMEVVV